MRGTNLSNKIADLALPCPNLLHTRQNNRNLHDTPAAHFGSLYNTIPRDVKHSAHLVRISLLSKNHRSMTFFTTFLLPVFPFLTLFIFLRNIQVHKIFARQSTPPSYRLLSSHASPFFVSLIVVMSHLQPLLKSSSYLRHRQFTLNVPPHATLPPTQPTGYTYLKHSQISTTHV